ncbi:MAG: SMP-30/gluconolactonase/LRE family protein [Acidobacteriaceae bacterium]|nr:SMP-30/gluconolactonase/LRE family protein [Acidobacteriaceae bacterium]MBV9765566.1 SMP-30/gluconolactonase/LRE family protein [Acidobacteriaceae bacterium]
MPPCRLALLAFLVVFVCNSQSFYTLRPDDAKAVYLEPPDGSSDESPALQRAIDRVQETAHHGIVFIPEGRYRIEHTVHVWAGIRLIGYGAKRPIFVLPANSSDFQSGPDHYMIWFTDERTPVGEPLADASEFTFYSALSNIDFELDTGNPAAVAIRFNVAQHSFITHSDFKLGSAKAALEAIGNQTSDIHVHGGQYGIITGKTSPAWQFLLMDSSFDGQQQAAISTHEAGFTLIRDRFSNVPVAIEIPEGQIEQLYARDLQLDHISRTAFQMGDVQNLRNEITLTNIACSHVAQFLRGAESIQTDSGPWQSALFYVEEQFTFGLFIGPDGREQGIQLHHRERAGQRAPAPLESDIPALPPMSEWTNVHTLGVKGDQNTDDTATIQSAIDTHRVLYFPSGLYRLTGSLHLRPDSVLIGLHPYTTQFVLNDGELAFQGEGAPMALLIAPPGGRTIVTGFGIATGNANARAAGVDWRAGERSMIEDVEFIRWHKNGAFQAAKKLELDAQYPSLWIHDGGGGVFRDIWSHSGMAKAGLLVEKTTTPGTIYQLSNEHHMQREVRFDHVSNWTMYDLQTEEEKPEGAEAFSLDLVSTRNLLFVNTYMYRVSRNITPQLYAVLLDDADNVVFSNVKVFSQTRLSFDNSIVDRKSGVQVRAHHFVHCALKGEMKQAPAPRLPAAFARNAKLMRVATGFSNASGLTSDESGAVYFTDAAMHSVYKCTDAGVKRIAKTDGMPQVIGFVAPFTLLAVNWERSVSSINPNTGEVKAVSPTDTRAPGTVLLLPAGLHNEEIELEWLLEGVGYQYRRGSNTATRSNLLPQPRHFYYAPDSKTAVLVGDTQKAYAAWAWRPLPESCQLAPFSNGTNRYITSEDDEKTYLATLQSENKLIAKLAMERGGTSVVTDSSGNVYIASGQVYVYDKEGRPAGVLEVPERPSSLAFGGTGFQTLFIGARSSIYSIEIARPGDVRR